MDVTQDVQVEKGLVGAVRGREVTMRKAAAGAVTASGDLIVTNGGLGAAAVGGNLAITNGGSGPIAAGGNVSIVNGGCQWIASGGGATLGERSFVGAVLAPRVVVEDGGKVLIDLPKAIAFGAAMGVAVGLIVRGRRT
ncbi:MAG: hypothetical protein ABI572_13100 [Actinomycetota bacterium]